MRAFLIGFCAVMLAAGCSSKASVVEVTGKVTLNGKPLPNAHIEFQPEPLPKSIEGEGLPSIGDTDVNGEYRLKIMPDLKPGAVVGEHMVKITASSGAPRKDGTSGPELLPEKYNQKSELKFTVKAGQPNVANFDLTLTK